jgi:hypothetical protein
MIADRLLVGFDFRGGGRCVFFESVHLTGGQVLKKNKQLGRVFDFAISVGGSCTIRRDRVTQAHQTQTRVFLGLQMQYPGSRRTMSSG